MATKGWSIELPVVNMKWIKGTGTLFVTKQSFPDGPPTKVCIGCGMDRPFIFFIAGVRQESPYGYFTFKERCFTCLRPRPMAVVYIQRMRQGVLKEFLMMRFDELDGTEWRDVSYRGARRPLTMLELRHMQKPRNQIRCQPGSKRPGAGKSRIHGVKSKAG